MDVGNYETSACRKYRWLLTRALFGEANFLASWYDTDFFWLSCLFIASLRSVPKIFRWVSCIFDSSLNQPIYFALRSERFCCVVFSRGQPTGFTNADNLTLVVGDIDEQCGLPTHKWHLPVPSSLTAATFVVTLFKNCVLIVLVGAGQCSRVSLALFCSKICCLALRVLGRPPTWSPSRYIENKNMPLMSRQPAKLVDITDSRLPRIQI